MVVEAQIEIDSTRVKSPYSPETTKFFTQEKVFYNDTLLYELDTLPNNVLHFENGEKYNYHTQDLGNVGSAVGWIYLKAPKEIGVTAGYTGYDIYFQHPNNIKYYDTKSPYTNLKIVLAQRNRNKVDVAFSRNVKKGWNVGFDFISIVSAKQIAGQGKNDFYSESTAYDFYTSYNSENEKYHLLATVSRIKHKISESNGLIPLSVNPENQLYGYNNSAAVWTNQATAINQRLQLRLYQQYKIKPWMQLFYQADLSKKENSYQDLSPNELSYKITDEEGLTTNIKTLYSEINFTDSETSEFNRFNVIQNKFGIKGFVNGFQFAGYLRQRNWSNDFKYLEDFSDQNEYYLGGELRYGFTEEKYINGATEVGQGGQYKINANWHNKWYDLTYKLNRSFPSIMMEKYLGNHGRWQNNFNPVLYNGFEGKINLEFTKFKFYPKGSLKTINQYLYLNAEKLPSQVAGFVSQTQLGMEWAHKFGSFVWEGEVLWTRSGGEQEVIPAPELFTFQKLYLERVIFDQVMLAQIGFSYMYRSDFFLRGYDSKLQSFYVQDDVEIRGYPVIDFFWKFKVQRFRGFLRLHNLVQFIESPRTGYFASAFYTGTPFVIDIGIGWQFFD